MAKEIALTTIDNPYNPFDDFTSWLMFDIEKGYNTNERLARITELKDDMTEQEQKDEIERGIERLISLDPLDIYIKVENKTGGEGS